MKLSRPTLRLRVALLYGGLVLFVGVALLVTALIVLTRNIRGAPRLRAEHALFGYGLIGFGIIVLIGAVGGYVIAGQALRPLTRLSETAREISGESPDKRITLGGPEDEVRGLADALNGMLARLDSAFESQRMFVANASHELRTPLAVIRTELDVTLSDPDADVAELRRMGEVVRGATERAQRLVDSLLTLARLQAVERGKLDVREVVDLVDLVPAVLAAADKEAAEKTVRLETDLQSAQTVGDPRLLERLIGNLVENAIRHNVPDGWVQVVTGETGSRIWLQVSNGGAVIPAGEVDRLFEPFRRGGPVRTASRGAGLGLAIVRLIVDAHHGRMQASARPTGGLAIRVDLPRAPEVPRRILAAGGSAELTGRD